MEPGIRQICSALNAVGIATYSSCRGHIERGSREAWIVVDKEKSGDVVEMLQKALHALQLDEIKVAWQPFSFQIQPPDWSECARIILDGFPCLGEANQIKIGEAVAAKIRGK